MFVQTIYSFKQFKTFKLFKISKFSISVTNASIFQDVSKFFECFQILFSS